MKRIILSALLMMGSAMGFAITVTVNNTSNTLGSCDGCDYEVNLKSLVFTKSGSTNWGYGDLTYFTITPGNNKVWTVSPPAGYAPDWSTLQIRVRWCSVAHTFGNGANGDDFNACDCGSTFNQTYWFRNADGNYDVQCEELSPRQGSAGGDQKFENITLETLPGSLTTVAPNPSQGLYTLTPGNDLAGQNYSVQVTDASGKVVYTKNNVDGKTPLQVDLTALTRGIYLLQVMSDKKKIMHKLVRE